jgi:hypothetical protein
MNCFECARVSDAVPAWYLRTLRCRALPRSSRRGSRASSRRIALRLQPHDAPREAAHGHAGELIDVLGKILSVS